MAHAAILPSRESGYQPHERIVLEGRLGISQPRSSELVNGKKFERRQSDWLAMCHHRLRGTVEVRTKADKTRPIEAV